MSMSTSNINSDVDHHHHHIYRPRCFLTPPATWTTRRRYSPAKFYSEKKPRFSSARIIRKIPFGDSPYVRAKRIQLVEKDPSKAVSLFWVAINSGDRVESALKDMATVMKQLDRSDEAIEAIKSFRHLCAPESQDSIDNVLVDLYKQSDRIEEEIEILHLQVKRVEEGLAFGGKRTKMFRCQGKRMHITVEKEYSRLLGNLAWAYMRQKDFRSAEEYYRKALSFDPNKNKQCNLAFCLMHMNKLREAKFLLQAVRSSFKNGWIDESYAKSYERASELLVKLESPTDHIKPKEPAKLTNRCRIDSGFVNGDLNKMAPVGESDHGFCCQKNGVGSEFPPMPLFLNKQNKKSFAESPCEIKAGFDWRRDIGQEEPECTIKTKYDSPFCSGGVLKVPLSEPRQCSRSFSNGGYRKSRRWGDSLSEGYRPKLSSLPCIDRERINRNIGYCSAGSNSDMPKRMPQSLDKHFPSPRGEWRKNSLGYIDKLNTKTVQPFSADCSETKKVCDEDSGQSISIYGVCDLQKEEEKEMEEWRKDFPHNYWSNPSQDSFFSYEIPGRVSIGLTNKDRFNDENVDPNILPETPTSTDQVEKWHEVDLENGYRSQPEETTIRMKEPVRRSLYFSAVDESVEV